MFQTTLVAALLAFGLYFDDQAASAPAAQTLAALRADLARASAAPEVQQVAAWAVDSQDHADLPFVVIDKVRARLFAFDAQGRLQGSAPVLLGASHDEGPAAHATPAGRFVTDPRWSAHTDDGIVWVRASTMLPLHGVPCDAAPDSASGSTHDKGSSDASLHVAADFYGQHLRPLRWQASVAYVLPEVLPWQQVFSPRRRGGMPMMLAQRAPRSSL